MRRQCRLLGVARSSVGYEAVPERSEDLKTKALLDKIYLEDPCLGGRRLVTVHDRDHGLKLNRKHLRRLPPGDGPRGDLVPSADEHSEVDTPQVILPDARS